MASFLSMVEAASQNIEQLLDTLKLDVESYQTLSRIRTGLTPHYLIRAKQGTFFLKIERPVRGMARARLRRLLGNPVLKRQVAVYRALSKRQFRSFRYPRLIETDEASYLLLEYITPRESGNSSEEFKSKLALSLLEFQTSGLQFEHAGVGNMLLDVVLSPGWAILRSAYFGVGKRCGPRFALRCLRTVLLCQRLQAKFEIPVVIHNDFHHDNVLVSDGNQVYITDFENVAMERRWLLLDIVHYAVGTQEFYVDLEQIRRYLLALRESGFRSAVNVAAQLRFALLRRMMLNLASDVPPEEVKRQCEQFISTVLLPDDAYRTWFVEHIERPQLEGMAA